MCWQQEGTGGSRHPGACGEPGKGAEGQLRGCGSLLLAPGTHKHLSPGKVQDKGHWDLVKHTTQLWHCRGISFCKRIYS